MDMVGYQERIKAVTLSKDMILNAMWGGRPQQQL
jgi:hypothetical protein